MVCLLPQLYLKQAHRSYCTHFFQVSSPWVPWVVPRKTSESRRGLCSIPAKDLPIHTILNLVDPEYADAYHSPFVHNTPVHKSTTHASDNHHMLALQDNCAPARLKEGGPKFRLGEVGSRGGGSSRAKKADTRLDCYKNHQQGYMEVTRRGYLVALKWQQQTRAPSWSDRKKKTGFMGQC